MLDQLQAALDSDPSDWAVRSALADLLEEQGDRDGAAAQRWMAQHQRHPEFLPFEDAFHGYQGWYWTVLAYERSSLPDVAFYRLAGFVYPVVDVPLIQTSWRWCLWRTRQESEAALAKALSAPKVSKLCRCCGESPGVRGDKEDRCRHCIDLGMVRSRRGWRQLGVYDG